jgi:pyruvate carboxylase
MFRKLLVANRGEIAIRAFRAANELGIRTAAIFAREDRASSHRIKADEAYEIGDSGHPVRAYLDIEPIIALAKSIKAEAIYPGYGFLAENPELARACVANGLVFVGPPADVMAAAGNKVAARESAMAAGVPVLAASGVLHDPEAVQAAAAQMQFPLFVKAAAGGGGRGIRLVEDPAHLTDAVASAMREADSAFGDPSVYLEQAIVHARHIEVQVLCDAAGNAVHLFERDCSIQRRQQKLIELAPAPGLPRDLRDALCRDAVRFAQAIDYVNAGTIEFLVDERRGSYVFMEMNTRIQVEHTVTEETTGVDLVRSQLQIAAGATLPELGLTQDRIGQRGYALQCRITTENPAQGFRPDTGRIAAYRAPGGPGIRVDEGSVYVGAEISPYYDSLLLKLIARADTFEHAISRARRAVSEVRIRGVATNQGFLQAVLDDPEFRAGHTFTTFVDERPWLATSRGSRDRVSKLLQRMAEVTVNQPFGTTRIDTDPAVKLPRLDSTVPPPAGSRQRLQELGPEGFARWLRAQQTVQLTDTTFRDAHQSLLATRMRSFDILAVAPAVAQTTPELLSLEVWGGATFDVALRFLGEDPWDRLERLRELIPNICLQMLLRGRNLLGYEPYDDRAVRTFVLQAADTGIDIFRIFDALNNVDPMRAAIEAAAGCGTIAEACLCYTGDLSNPDEKIYTIDYYVRLAEQLVRAGAHILAIKDMAGLLRAPAARTLISRLRAEFDLPVHLHSHDTAGGQLATYLAAIEAGVDAVDGAAAPLAGMTSQPAISAIVAATAYTDRATDVSLDALLELEPYWEEVRSVYAPFESGVRAPTGRVYRHEMPGGQISNLRQQAIAVGLGDRFEEVEDAYERANLVLGNIVKVTPSSKVVGDLALFAVSGRIDWDELVEHPERFDLPDSVLAYLRGDLGQPAAGIPQPFAERALRSRESGMPPALRHLPEDLPDDPDERRAALARLMFPGPYEEFVASRDLYGDVSVLPSRLFFYGLHQGHDEELALEPGVRFDVRLDAVGDPDEAGDRNVMMQVNGELRLLRVQDEAFSESVRSIVRADPDDPNEIAAPLAGILTIFVEEGEWVEEGHPIATLEAMKMESTIMSPRPARIMRVSTRAGQRIESGELVVVLEPTDAG